MTAELHGSGIATACAVSLLNNLARRAEHSLEEGKAQAEFVDYVREQVAAEFTTLRDQRDAARNTAVQYEAVIAHQADVIAELREAETLGRIDAA